MKPEFIVLALILLGALYLFWTQRLRTDIAALLVMLSLAQVSLLGANFANFRGFSAREAA